VKKRYILEYVNTQDSTIRGLYLVELDDLGWPFARCLKILKKNGSSIDFLPNQIIKLEPCDTLIEIGNVDKENVKVVNLGD